MALDTFKAQLKAKAKTLGVTNLANKRIDAYAATLEKQNPNLTTDDDHAEKVDAFLELVDIKEIAAMDDRNRSNAKKDDKQDDKKDNQGKDDKQEPPADDPNVPAWAKALIESNKTLMETVGNLQKEKSQQSMQSRLKETLKDVPHSLYKKWALPEKDEDFDAFVEEVQNEWTEFTKENPVTPAAGGAGAASSGGAGGHKPGRGGGGAGEKATKEEVDNILNSII